MTDDITRLAWSSKIISKLAALTCLRVSDEHFDAEVLPREAVMDAVCKIRDATREGEAVIRTLAQQGKAGGVQIIGWIYEDRLPAGYPYDAMFPHSRVDGVRLFPVFAPPPAAQHEGSAAERTGTVADISDEELLRRAVFNLARPGRRSPREFAWTRIMDVFGLGSTYSTQLCRRFERDPDTGKPIAPQPKDAP